MTTLYGIKNCDTVRKARTWLEKNQVNYQFHDFRVEGLDEDLLQILESRLGWKTLLNRRSNTWRQLSEKQKSGIDKTLSMQLMIEQPTLIKRPILDTGEKMLIGFSASQYESEL